MTRKSVTERQKKREVLIDQAFAKRKKLRERCRDSSLTDAERRDAMLQLQKMPRDTAPVRSRTRCNLTGRPRGVIRLLGMAGMKTRALLMEGKIPGARKASW